MTIKTEQQVERDFYALLAGSPLGRGLRGSVLRQGVRPADARTEDLVVKFLAGEDAQVQSGVVVLNIYIPDVPLGRDGRKVADFARIAELEQLVLDFVAQSRRASEYQMQTDGTPRAYPVEGIEQHLIAARIAFRRLAE